MEPSIQTNTSIHTILQTSDSQRKTTQAVGQLVQPLVLDNFLEGTPGILDKRIHIPRLVELVKQDGKGR